MKNVDQILLRKKLMSKYVQQAVDAIIRPPRYEYNYKELPLFLNAHDHKVYMRHPLVIENKRNQHIIGSLFHMADSSPMKGGPCVIYLHGNASAQLEGQFLVPNFCPHNIYVFVYDAIGCGCSDGDYISLGYFEKQDIEEIMEFLNQAFGLGPFALWGRSMGAATAALAKSHLLQSIVCDSAYTSIPDIVYAIAKSLGIPGFVVPLALKYLRSKIEKIAKFDLNTVEPIEAVKAARVPAVFGHAIKDQFVPFEMGKKLFETYACADKMFFTFERGGHNSRRNAEWIRTCVEFIVSRFGMDTFGIEISECRYLQSSKYHFTSFDRLLQNKESNGAIPRNTDSDNSTEDLTESIRTNSTSEFEDSKLIAGCDSEEASACTDAEVSSSSKEEAYLSDSGDQKSAPKQDKANLIAEDETKNAKSPTEVELAQKNETTAQSPIESASKSEAENLQEVSNVERSAEPASSFNNQSTEISQNHDNSNDFNQVHKIDDSQTNKDLDSPTEASLTSQNQNAKSDSNNGALTEQLSTSEPLDSKANQNPEISIDQNQELHETPLNENQITEPVVNADDSIGPLSEQQQSSQANTNTETTEEAAPSNEAPENPNIKVDQNDLPPQ